jgi:hypothetical protein
VAISGDTLVVGAAPEDAGVDNIENAGAAYVFMRNHPTANSWGQVKKLIASEPAPNDYFGGAVTIDGDMIVIGANERDLEPDFDTGGLFIFKRNQGGLNQWGQAYAVGHDEAGAFMGDAVAVTGSGLIVAGAPGGDSAVEDGGVAYAYCLNDVLEENDSSGEATAIGPSLLDLQICGGDLDVFEVEAEAGEQIDVRLNFTHANGDLDVYLFHSSNLGTPVLGSTGTVDNESMRYTVPADGIYYVLVQGYESALNRYSLSLSTNTVYVPFVRR